MNVWCRESQSPRKAIDEGEVCDLGREYVIKRDKEAPVVEDFLDCLFVQDRLDEGALSDSSGSQQRHVAPLTQRFAYLVGQLLPPVKDGRSGRW